MSRATRRMLLTSTSRQLLDHMSVEREFSDAEIARVIGERRSFVAMVRLGHLPLLIEHVERLADAVGLRVGAFLTAALPTPVPKTPEQAEWQRAFKRISELGDRTLEALEQAKLARRHD